MASSRSFRESREALLKSGAKWHRRSPTAEDWQSSSEEELELDELNNSKAESHQATRNPSWLGVLRRCGKPGLNCIVITAILLGGLILLLGVGSLWVYKSAPRDGVCQPSYNNPLSLTGRALGIASMVSITARGHVRLVGRQLSKGRGIG